MIPTIPTTNQQKDFFEYLSNEDNFKIIFSAKFGSGKTTFLKKFFNEYKSDYTPIYLYPVNYSVAGNEDIFELIKYDILLQLLQLDDIDKYLTDIPSSLAAQVLFISQPINTIRAIIQHIPKTGIDKFDMVAQAPGKICSGIDKLYDKLNEFKDTQKINKFKQEITDSIGNIYEQNTITATICSIIEKYKEENKDKKIVLIIDDLDRIDPEHIFRILNVLAAHHDIQHDVPNSTDNKFGFNKIITVCDIDNIKSIFHFRYGDKTDFNGYIGKFYSRQIYYFDFRIEIIKLLDEICSDFMPQIYGPSEKLFKNLLIQTLSELVYYNEININTIVKKFRTDLFVKKLKTYYYNKSSYSEHQIPIIRLFNFLCLIFDGEDNLFNSINNIISLNIDYEYGNVYYLLCEIIRFETYEAITSESTNPNGSVLYIKSKDNSYFNIGYTLNQFDEIQIMGISIYNKQLSMNELIALKSHKFHFWEILSYCFLSISQVINYCEKNQDH